MWRGGTTVGLSFPSPEGRGDQRGEDKERREVVILSERAVRARAKDLLVVGPHERQVLRMDKEAGRGPGARTRAATATGHATARHTIRRMTLAALRHQLPRRGARRSSQAAQLQTEGNEDRLHASPHSCCRSAAPSSHANSALKKALVQKRE